MRVTNLNRAPRCRAMRLESTMAVPTPPNRLPALILSVTIVTRAVSPGARNVRSGSTSRNRCARTCATLTLGASRFAS